MALLLLALSLTFTAVALLGCIKTIFRLSKPTWIEGVGEKTGQAFLGLTLTAGALFAAYLFQTDRLDSFAIGGVGGRIRNLEDRVDTLESFYRSRKTVVFDETNWDQLEVDTSQEPDRWGCYPTQFQAEGKVIAGSVVASRGLIAMPAYMITVEGSTIRLCAGPAEYQDLPLVVQYHIQNP